MKDILFDFYEGKNHLMTIRIIGKPDGEAVKEARNKFKKSFPEVKKFQVRKLTLR